MLEMPENQTTLETVAQRGDFCQFHMSNGYVARGKIIAIHPDGWFELNTNPQPLNGAQLVRIEAR